MYVYFIQAFGEKDLIRIKIGRSKDPQSRMRQLQIGSAVKLKMLGTVKCQSPNHARIVENLAHDIFRDQRRRGEWFRLSVKHLAKIKSVIEKAAAVQ